MIISSIKRCKLFLWQKKISFVWIRSGLIIELEAAGSDKDERTITWCNSSMNILLVLLSPQLNAMAGMFYDTGSAWYWHSHKHLKLSTSTVIYEDRWSKCSESKIRRAQILTGEGVDREDDDIDFLMKVVSLNPPCAAIKVINKPTVAWAGGWGCVAFVCFYTTYQYRLHSQHRDSLRHFSSCLTSAPQRATPVAALKPLSSMMALLSASSWIHVQKGKGWQCSNLNN